MAEGHVLVCVMAALSGLVRGRSGSGRGDHGATAVEYALMASLIALVIVASVTRVRAERHHPVRRADQRLQPLAPTD